MDVTKEVFLYEDMVTPPYEADDLYGWAKLMAELTLKGIPPTTWSANRVLSVLHRLWSQMYRKPCCHGNDR